MRSRAPPVADAARRSTRSGRKNRASEQREDFFGHRKADGADAPAATLGAYLCAVRTMLQHRSYPALQATERGSSRGKLSPLTVFWFLLYAQKERPGGEPYRLCTLQNQCPAARCPPIRPKTFSLGQVCMDREKNRPTVFPLLRGRAPEFAGIRAEHLSDHGKSGKSPAVSGERFCWTGPVRPL